MPGVPLRSLVACQQGFVELYGRLSMTQRETPYRNVLTSGTIGRTHDGRSSELNTATRPAITAETIANPAALSTLCVSSLDH